MQTIKLHNVCTFTYILCMQCDALTQQLSLPTEMNIFPVAFIFSSFYAFTFSEDVLFFLSNEFQLFFFKKEERRKIIC